MPRNEALLPAFCRTFAKLSPSKKNTWVEYWWRDPPYKVPPACDRHPCPLHSSRCPIFLGICLKNSCGRPGPWGPSGCKFIPKGFLRRTSS